MNARVLIVAVAAGVVAALAVAGVMMLLVLALFTSAGFEPSPDVRLPESELAGPTEADFDTTVSVYLTRSGTVVMGEREASVGEAPSLIREFVKQLDAELSAADFTVIICADPDAPTGTVQELIKAFQASGFERFVLRGREED